MHGGEGSQSKANFQQLAQADKARIIKFLESL
jgi:CxxC motif-containing protein (DUF1111 family)